MPSVPCAATGNRLSSSKIPPCGTTQSYLCGGKVIGRFAPLCSAFITDGLNGAERLMKYRPSRNDLFPGKVGFGIKEPAAIMQEPEKVASTAWV